MRRFLGKGTALRSKVSTWRWLTFSGLATALSVGGSAFYPGPARPGIGILQYIRETWPVLTRTHKGLAVAAADPKFPAPADGRWPVYLASSEDAGRVEKRLREEMGADAFGKIRISALPPAVGRIREQGLLYLPLPYVVPGGRFNEMYGWDSYFIQMGLLRDGETELAKDLAENALYEIREYGKILNANRTYYLTRSQPPFLTAMLLAVYERTKDREWLAASVPAIESYYRYWTSEPHLTPETGLSRYFDSGHGPAPEVVSSELDQKGRTDYDLVRAYFRTHKVPDYDASRFYDAGRDELTEAFYDADRAMRESGFDPSNRFGPFNAGILEYDPVCLNSLLYLMEMQTAEVVTLAGTAGEAQTWTRRAEERARRMNRLMWSQRDGLYYDYDFTRRTLRPYPFLTTFYPLWAGIASQEQAARVMSNLELFERAGGLQTSTYRSGDQWDAPFAWAPLQWIAVQGMRRYGFRAEAERISKKFLSMVQGEYQKHGAIVEKYDAVTRHAAIARELQFGYHSNEAGFGWTNAVFTALYDGLDSHTQAELKLSSVKR